VTRGRLILSSESSKVVYDRVPDLMEAIVEQPIFDDTPLEVERVMLDLWRKLTPQQRLARARAMSRRGRQMMLANAARQNPDATQAERVRMVAKWTLPDDLFNAAYGSL